MLEATGYMLEAVWSDLRILLTSLTFLYRTYRTLLTYSSQNIVLVGSSYPKDLESRGARARGEARS